ncbi:Fic family protein [Anseongella ginsenosidimutans]
MELGLIAYTIPAKPNSRLQKYRITPSGYEYITLY